VYLQYLLQLTQKLPRNITNYSRNVLYTNELSSNDFLCNEFYLWRNESLHVPESFLGVRPGFGSFSLTGVCPFPGSPAISR
jgi:hypothetical protein